MQIRTNADGYIDNFALEGNMVDSTEINLPDNIEHFLQHYNAYRIKNGTLFFDEDQDKAIQFEAENEQLRDERNTECFSVINRGWLWYDSLSENQTKELRKWYQDWLDVTATHKKPEKPSWLK